MAAFGQDLNLEDLTAMPLDFDDPVDDDEPLVQRFNDPTIELNHLDESEKTTILERHNESVLLPDMPPLYTFASRRDSISYSKEDILDFWQSNDACRKYIVLGSVSGKNPHIKFSKLAGTIRRKNDKGEEINTDIPKVTFQLSDKITSGYPLLLCIKRSQQSSKKKRKLNNGTSSSSSSSSSGNNQGEQKVDNEFHENVTFHKDVTIKEDLHVKGTVRTNGRDFAEWFPFKGKKPKLGDIGHIKRQENESFFSLDTSGDGTVCVVSDSTQAGSIGGKEDNNKILIAFVGQIVVNIDDDDNHLQEFDKTTTLSVIPSGNNDGRAKVIEGSSGNSACFGVVLEILEKRPDVATALVLVAPFSKPKSQDYATKPEFHEFCNKVLSILEAKPTQHDITNIILRIKHGVQLWGCSKDDIIGIGQRAKRLSQEENITRNSVGLFFTLMNQTEEEKQNQCNFGCRGDASLPVLKLREYQKEIVEQVVESTQNGVMVLGTGMGKTRVAIDIIKETLKTNPEKCAVVLAPTRILVLEHCAELRHVFASDPSCKIRVINGNQLLENVDPNTGTQDVWIMTPGSWEAKQWEIPSIQKSVSLIVLDECHSAVSRHGESKSNYSTLLEKFANLFCGKIIGLTATPDSAPALLQAFGNDAQWFHPTGKNLKDMKQMFIEHESSTERINCNRRNTDQEFGKKIMEMMEIMGCKDYEITSLTDTASQVISKVQRYASGGRPKLKDCKLFGPNSDLQRNVRRILSNESKIHIRTSIERIIQLCMTFSFALRITIETGKEASQYRLCTSTNQRVGFVSAFRACLETTGIAAERAKQVRQHSLCQELLQLSARPPKSILVNVQHPKYLQLKITLLEQFELNSSSNEPTRVMVFVNYRESASVLKHMIENDIELNDRFFPLTCVGKGKGNGSFEVMNDRQQQSAVLEFKNKDKDCNILIATSVLYEGIDVQACNAVVMFSSVPRGVAWIQAAGRARQKGSVTKIFYYECCIEERLADKSEKEANEIERWINEIEMGGAVNESCASTPTNEEGEIKMNNEEGEAKNDTNWKAPQNYVADLQHFTQINLLPLPKYEFDVSTGLPCSSFVTVSGFVKEFHSKEESTIRLTTKKDFKQYVAHLWLDEYQNKVLEGNQAGHQQLRTIAPATPAIAPSSAPFSNEWDSTKNYVAELQEYVAQTLRVDLPVYAFDVPKGLPSSCSVTVKNDSINFQSSTTVVNLTKKIQYKQYAAFLWLGKHKK